MVLCVTVLVPVVVGTPVLLFAGGLVTSWGPFVGLGLLATVIVVPEVNRLLSAQRRTNTMQQVRGRAQSGLL